MKRSDIIETLKEMLDVEMDAKNIEALEGALSIVGYGWLSCKFTNPRGADLYNVVIHDSRGAEYADRAWWDGKKWTKDALLVNVTMWAPIFE